MVPHPPLIAMLDAVVPIDRVAPAEEERVRHLIRRALPPGAPGEAPDGFVVAVTAVTADALGRIVADVVLFDGAAAVLEISGTPAPGGELAVRWLRDGSEVPFGYDRTIGAWRRYPEHTADAETYADAFARLAIEEAVAEKRRASARLAAETRRRKREAARAGA